MKVVIHVLLLTWASMVSSRDLRGIRSRHIDDDTDVNLSIDGTVRLLNRIKNFLDKVETLTYESSALSSRGAMIILPNLLEEAAGLMSELDENPVKEEDAKAVERVKDMLESSLHAFKIKYDQASTTMTTPSTTQEPEPSPETTELPESELGINSDTEPEPETTTILTPVPEESVQAKTNLFKNEQKKVPNEDTVVPAKTQNLRPLTLAVSHPFSSNKFRFTAPVSAQFQRQTPIIKQLPSGGYYVYYHER